MMTNEQVDRIEKRLKEIQAEVEDQGRRICSDRDKADDWHWCNRYLEKVEELIHGAYRFRDMGG